MKPKMVIDERFYFIVSKHKKVITRSFWKQFILINLLITILYKDVCIKKVVATLVLHYSTVVLSYVIMQYKFLIVKALLKVSRQDLLTLAVKRTQNQLILLHFLKRNVLVKLLHTSIQLFAGTISFPESTYSFA